MCKYAGMYPLITPHPCPACYQWHAVSQAEALAAMGAPPDKVVFLDAPRAVLMESAHRAGKSEDELLARLDSRERLQGCVLPESVKCRLTQSGWVPLFDLTSFRADSIGSIATVRRWRIQWQLLYEAAKAFGRVWPH